MLKDATENVERLIQEIVDQEAELQRLKLELNAAFGAMALQYEGILERTRTKKRLSQQDMAERAGVAQAYISYAEAGAWYRMTPEAALAVLRAYASL